MTNPILVNLPLLSISSGWENKFRASKNFLEEYIFEFVEHLCNRRPKNENKKFKKYILILANGNWLDGLLLFMSLIRLTKKRCGWVEKVPPAHTDLAIGHMSVSRHRGSRSFSSIQNQILYNTRSITCTILVCKEFEVKL